MLPRCNTKTLGITVQKIRGLKVLYRTKTDHLRYNSMHQKHPLKNTDCHSTKSKATTIS